MNNISILFSWHKNLEELVSRFLFLPSFDHPSHLNSWESHYPKFMCKSIGKNRNIIGRQTPHKDSGRGSMVALTVQELEKMDERFSTLRESNNSKKWDTYTSTRSTFTPQGSVASSRWVWKDMDSIKFDLMCFL